MRRRQVFQLLAAGAISLTTASRAADNLLTARKFDHLTTDVKVFETNGGANGELTMVLGGLGVQDSEPIMRALLPSIGESHYVGAVRLGDNGFDIDTIADGINRAHHELGFRAINFFLHSMSGTLLPDIVPRLDKGLPEKIIRTDYNCTPWTKEYVVDQAWVDAIGRLPIDGSWGTKLTTQIIDRLTRPQVEDLSPIEKAKVILRTTNDIGSPMTWTALVRYLYKLQENHYDNLPERIESRLIVPRIIGSDNVVDLEAVIEAYPRIIPGVTDSRPVLVNARGHANPRQYPQEYNQALKITSVFDSSRRPPRLHRRQLRPIE